MKNTSKSTKSIVKPNGPEPRKDRKSASGVNGSPKKGGHGGKFTWVGDGYSPAELGLVDKEAVTMDANDPNVEDRDVAAP
ncbi:hypothetical protein F511_26052 [Dorcoceras hygrometricum]|uniref:Programmed cell death protein 4-like n=1 Tax=Dorcoceras hygrometricum TaxID=472368 RepID=A0A2Z7CLP7_9LAMI|nr:hypothetical protein F511_34018 [Dorcoceras hygrometricum]KZV50192.1 hypothetical protein F511_26052 [Dorcoceras hygrometricum]